MRIGHLVAQDCGIAVLSNGGAIEIGTLESNNCFVGIWASNNAAVAVQNYDFVDTAKAVRVSEGAKVVLGSPSVDKHAAPKMQSQFRRKGIRRYVAGWVPPI